MPPHTVCRTQLSCCQMKHKVNATSMHAAAQADREKAEAEERAQREAQQESARMAAAAQAAAAAAAEVIVQCSVSGRNIV